MANDYDAGDVYPRSPTRQPFRGPRRTHRETGRTEVWVEGQGYVPQGSLYTVPTQDREAVQAAQNSLATARRNAMLAEQFSEVNRTPRPSEGLDRIFNSGGETGGSAGLPTPDFLQNPTRQRMEGITNQMVRANIQPGQAGTMNSMFEQILARQQYPTTGTYGSTNDERVVQMLVDADEIAAALDEMERRVRDQRTLEGFQQYWTREGSPRVRAEAERRHRERLGLTQRQSGGQPQGGGAPRNDDPLGIR